MPVAVVMDFEAPPELTYHDVHSHFTAG